MPARADQALRRREIVAAAVDLIAERSVHKLTLRGVAARLGGSVTLITHYYDSRDALLDDVSAHLARTWKERAFAVPAQPDDPWSSLRAVLQALLPTTPSQLSGERAYFRFVAASDELPAAAALLRRSDRNVRDLLRRQLTPLVPQERLPDSIDYLKAVLLGITNGACEFGWSRNRQLRTLDLALETVAPLATTDRSAETT